MRKLMILICSAALSLAAQQQTIEKPFIEITGTSETEIVPDIIEVTIILREYVEGKNKMDIGRQEENLRTQLGDLGIDLKQLTIVTAAADYQKIRMMKKDVVNSKTYLLKLGNADILAKVYERLDMIDVYNAHVSRLDHSKLLEYQKENRIKAIKAAKEKAEYLLSAIGKSAGSPLQVNEGENWVDHGPSGPRPVYHSSRNALQTMEYVEADKETESISIRKIKIRSGYVVKFEIK